MKPNDRVLAILTHVLALFFSFLAPLIVLLVSKSDHVKKHAKKALNWQLSRMIYSLVSAILVFLLVGIFFLAALGVLNLVFCIIAAVKAGNDELWDYPLSIKFFKV